MGSASFGSTLVVTDLAAAVYVYYKTRGVASGD